MSAQSSSYKEQQLQELFEQIRNCQACKLSKTRNKMVFGEGSADADILFIGEGPGKEENETGRPFVGRAGQLLTAIIEKGMALSRSSVYIANIVKCRPTVDMAGTRDRPPDEEEVNACSPFLLRQIEIIDPRVIITLGNPSTRFLLKTKAGITTLRGRWHMYRHIPVMPTYHPSYILRNGNDSSPLKRDVWNDVKEVLHYLSTGELPADLKRQIDEHKSRFVLHEKTTDRQGRLF